jgi:hypothetical protein
MVMLMVLLSFTKRLFEHGNNISNFNVIIINNNNNNNNNKILIYIYNI